MRGAHLTTRGGTGRDTEVPEPSLLYAASRDAPKPTGQRSGGYLDTYRIHYTRRENAKKTHETGFEFSRVGTLPAH